MLSQGRGRVRKELPVPQLVTTGVGVTVVFPGAIRTDITNAARGSHADLLASMGRSPLAPLAMRPPSAVARRIVKAIERDRARVTVGPDARAVDLLTRLYPGRSGLIGRVTKVTDGEVEIDLGGMKVKAVKSSLSQVVDPTAKPAND